jgi:hypothetical protein
MKSLKDRAETILLFMLGMDPSGNEPHMPLECTPAYDNGEDEEPSAMYISGPMDSDCQPTMFKAYRWPGEDDIWTADLLTDMPHVIDELLVYTSDLEAEVSKLNRAVERLTDGQYADSLCPPPYQRDECGGGNCLGCWKDYAMGIVETEDN